ncbi:hypothetical protein LCGC14_1902600 [marine sediment metagenome]|uniref:Uncharacterized protein n=1 Tax=marine sediment metagenome TaxID=412755 RepID=A0A0F9FWE8_9ZZZZ
MKEKTKQEWRNLGDVMIWIAIVLIIGFVWSY